MRPFLLLAAAGLLSVVACSLGSATTPQAPPPTLERPPVYTGLGLDALEGYRSSFELRFRGDFEWLYQLETRSDGRTVEYRLHLEGLSGESNPGDIRLVDEAGVSSMRGPGTDEECVVFPSDTDLGPVFLTPDDLLDPAGLSEPLVSLGTERIADVETTHYALLQPALGRWRELEVGIWLHELTGAALRYDLKATGPDQLFGAGEGVLTGRFLVEAIGPQNTQPVQGCEIPYPLPDEVERLVKLPGLVSFESRERFEDLAEFYARALDQSGWRPSVDPVFIPDGADLEYERDGEGLRIRLRETDGVVRVELFTGGQ